MPGYFVLLSLFLLAGSCLAQYDCPPQGGAYALCGTTVLYILDTSTDMTDSDIGTEFDWIRYHIVPGTAWGTSQKLALISYGTGNVASFIPTGERTKACAQLNSLQVSYNGLGSDNVTLLATIESVDLFYQDTVNNMVLFSASENRADIKETGDYIKAKMPSKHFTVIAMDGADFGGFPATVIYNISSLAQSPPNLASCLIKNACDQGDDCNIYGATDAPVYFPTTTEAPPPTTAPRVTTVSPQQSTVAYPPQTTAYPSGNSTNLACTCNYGQVWLDVIYLFDASAATGAQGLDTMWGLVGTMVDYFNIQRTGYVGTNYTTRVGIITYGNQATIYKPLGSVNNDDLDNIYALPFNNEASTNLEAGLQAANTELQGPNSRPNAKRVIVVMAASYNPTGVTAPQEVAKTFKEDGGILMVFNYIDGHGQAVPTLQELASPGYFFSTTLSSTYQDLMNAFCDANCFCAINYAVYAQSARGYPTQGCYLGAPITTNYRLASNKCSMFNKGFLAFDESYSKNIFLAAQLPSGSTFLLGLTFDSNYRQWMWSDGTPLGSYAPWAGGFTPNGSNGATCVYANTNGQWVATDCRNGYYYVCETPACDSVHYCP